MWPAWSYCTNLMEEKGQAIMWPDKKKFSSNVNLHNTDPHMQRKTHKRHQTWEPLCATVSTLTTLIHRSWIHCVGPTDWCFFPSKFTNYLQLRCSGSIFKWLTKCPNVYYPQTSTWWDKSQHRWQHHRKSSHCHQQRSPLSVWCFPALFLFLLFYPTATLGFLWWGGDKQINTISSNLASLFLSSWFCWNCAQNS